MYFVNSYINFIFGRKIDGFGCDDVGVGVVVGDVVVFIIDDNDDNNDDDYKFSVYER